MGFVAVIGAGALGGATTHALARRERVREVRLIDPEGTIARGKALDLSQAAPVEHFSTRARPGSPCCGGSPRLRIAPRSSAPARSSAN
jgi:malate/lactate dehydrogenase